ncbi:MAG: GNAT family N-acetyltransferase [Streptomyces sp.]|uniref:GNAT family N-acetyltransferase n=1 Tax=Streptomyces sp. TaxID=1931 RepID=UPI0025DD94E1|nr:GNAT family N-acetyltransferase [Streptomyces sp.]MBW8792777.1 GNAT family N-acetyltransferase [Streptomyces sp.]
MAPESSALAWHFTADVDEFLNRAHDFLHSRPDLCTVHLTVTAQLRLRGPRAYGDDPPFFGFLTRGDGGVAAALLHTPPYALNVTRLTADETEALAERLLALGHPVSGISAERATSEAFAAEWERRTGVSGKPRELQRLYRLAESTPPVPVPEGRARPAGASDRDLLIRWYERFVADAGLRAGRDAAEWADFRLSYGGVTLWETPDGTPVSMAGVTLAVAGQVRIAPVYTPPDLRGRGYAGAVTTEVGRAALAAGAAEVLLFADLANPTSNALYQRIGYRKVADWAVYDLGEGA